MKISARVGTDVNVLEIDGKATVGVLKKEVEKVTGVPAVAQCLKFKGKEVKGDGKVVGDVIEDGGEVEVLLTDKELALMCASAQDLEVSGEELRQKIRGGVVEDVRCLCEAGLDVNVTSSTDLTPVQVAAGNGETAIVSLLLHHGATISHTDEYNRTPLFYAARDGTVDTIKLCIEHGNDVNDVDTNNRNPLHYAVWYNNIDAVRHLLESNARISDATFLRSLQVSSVKVIKALTEVNSDLLKLATEFSNYRASVRNYLANLEPSSPLFHEDGVESEGSLGSHPTTCTPSLPFPSCISTATSATTSSSSSTMSE